MSCPSICHCCVAQLWCYVAPVACSWRNGMSSARRAHGQVATVSCKQSDLTSHSAMHNATFPYLQQKVHSYSKAVDNCYHEVPESKERKPLRISWDLSQLTTSQATTVCVPTLRRSSHCPCVDTLGVDSFITLTIAAAATSSGTTDYNALYFCQICSRFVCTDQNKRLTQVSYCFLIDRVWRMFQIAGTRFEVDWI